MPIRVEFDFLGEKQVNREFTLLEGRVLEPEPAFRRIADFLRGVERRQFTTKGSFSGFPWAPLAGSTVLKKTLGGSRHPDDTLRDTDMLFRSLTVKGAPRQVFVMTNSWMKFGTRHKAASFHQEGTRRMPRRRIFNLTEANRSEVVRILQGWIVSGKLNAGVFR